MSIDNNFEVMGKNVGRVRREANPQSPRPTQRPKAEKKSVGLPTQTDAEKFVSREDYITAIAIYEEMLENSPNNKTYQSRLDEIKILASNSDQQADNVAGKDAEPDKTAEPEPVANTNPAPDVPANPEPAGPSPIPDHSPETNEPLDPLKAGFEKFNIKPEELEALAGFKDLSETQKRFVLENFEQVTLGRVQEEAAAGYRQEAGQGRWYKKMWVGAFKQYYQAKHQQASAQELLNSGFAAHKKILQTLVENAGQVGVIETERGLEVQYLSGLKDLSPRQEEAVANFNQVAARLSHLPYEWTLPTATKEQRQEYNQAQIEFNLTRKDVKQFLAEKKGNTIDATVELARIDNKLRLQQFLNTHPEVEEEFQKINSQSVLAAAFKTVAVERGGYLAFGAGARYLTVSLIGMAAAPIVAGVLGGWAGRARGKKSLSEQDAMQRKGVDLGLKQEVKKNFVKAEDLTKKLDHEINKLPRYSDPNKKQVNYEKILSSIKTRVEYTKDKLENGLVDFGDKESRLINQQLLIKQLNDAENIIVIAQENEKVMARLEGWLGRQEGRIDKARRKYLNDQMATGIFYGASFATIGYAARHFLAGMSTEELTQASDKILKQYNDIPNVIEARLQPDLPLGEPRPEIGIGRFDPSSKDFIQPDLTQTPAGLPETFSADPDIVDTEVVKPAGETSETISSLSTDDTEAAEPDLPRGPVREVQEVKSGFNFAKPAVEAPVVPEFDYAHGTGEGLEEIKANTNFAERFKELIGTKNYYSAVIEKGGNLSKALGLNDLTANETITVINPDGTTVLNADADLVHPGDVAVVSEGQIYVFNKDSGMAMDEGIELQPSLKPAIEQTVNADQGLKEAGHFTTETPPAAPLTEIPASTVPPAPAVETMESIRAAIAAKEAETAHLDSLEQQTLQADASLEAAAASPQAESFAELLSRKGFLGLGKHEISVNEAVDLSRVLNDAGKYPALEDWTPKEFGEFQIFMNFLGKDNLNLLKIGNDYHLGKTSFALAMFDKGVDPRYLEVALQSIDSQQQYEIAQNLLASHDTTTVAQVLEVTHRLDLPQEQEMAVAQILANKDMSGKAAVAGNVEELFGKGVTAEKITVGLANSNITFAGVKGANPDLSYHFVLNLDKPTISGYGEIIGGRRQEMQPLVLNETYLGAIQKSLLGVEAEEVAPARLTETVPATAVETAPIAEQTGTVETAAVVQEPVETVKAVPTTETPAAKSPEALTEKERYIGRRLWEISEPYVGKQFLQDDYRTALINNFGVDGVGQKEYVITDDTSIIADDLRAHDRLIAKGSFVEAETLNKEKIQPALDIFEKKYGQGVLDREKIEAAMASAKTSVVTETASAEPMPDNEFPQPADLAMENPAGQLARLQEACANNNVWELQTTKGIAELKINNSGHLVYKYEGGEAIVLDETNIKSFVKIMELPKQASR